MRATLIVRVRILSIVAILAAILLSARLYYIQILRGDAYALEGQKQYEEVAPDVEKRGTIYFSSRDGTLVAAAVMKTGWRVAIVPKILKDGDAAYEALRKILPLDRERFMASAKKRDDPHEDIAVRVDEETARRIRELDIPGVILLRDEWRSYPGKTLAAQAIGFVGYQGKENRRVGVYGLERSWQETLAKPQSGLYVNPFAELFSNIRTALSSDASVFGGSIVTTLEPTVQKELEDLLAEIQETYSAKLAGGIVMDPKTGEIIALALRPTFDPNSFNTVEDIEVFQNPLVEGRYELGSIMKPLTVAAGIDSGAISTSTTYRDEGCIARSGKTICNFDRKARNVVGVQEILNQSLNLGATFVAERMGKETFARYLHSYGLGEKTGIDLPNEVQGSLATIAEGTGPDINFATASFGQGISVSPIGMTRALSALGNGGVMPNPHVVREVRFDSGFSRKISVPSGVRVMSTTTALTVTDMLVKVYDTALLQGALKREHHSIAAKTGTAQIARPGGGYYSDRFLHSFFGYFPAYEPRFIVFLMTIEPRGVEYASASLARPFDALAGFLINYYSIPPDR